MHQFWHRLKKSKNPWSVVPIYHFPCQTWISFKIISVSDRHCPIKAQSQVSWSDLQDISVTKFANTKSGWLFYHSLVFRQNLKAVTCWYMDARCSRWKLSLTIHCRSPGNLLYNKVPLQDLSCQKTHEGCFLWQSLATTRGGCVIHNMNYFLYHLDNFPNVITVKCGINGFLHSAIKM